MQGFHLKKDFCANSITFLSNAVNLFVPLRACWVNKIKKTKFLLQTRE